MAARAIMPLLRLWLQRLLWCCLPWSIEWPVGGGVNLLLPAEVIAGVLAVLFWWNNRIGAVLSRYWWVVIWQGWGWLATLFSEYPIVSAKSTIAMSAYITVFYFSAAEYTQEECNRWGRYFSLSFSGVIIWVLVRHGVWFHWRADQANLAPMPFFPDHNMYAAVAVAVFFLVSKWWNQYRGVRILLMIWYGTAVVFSTSRAALATWLLGVGVALMLQYWPWRRVHTLIGVALLWTMLLGAMLIQLPVLARFFRQDVSLAERWNRYDCAGSMVAARPLTGYGPGTYALSYLPWQRPEWRTRISIDEPLKQRDPSNFGRGGGAHSEYWKALAETGWPGFILFLLVWGMTAFRLGQQVISYNRVDLWAFVAFVTLFFHFLINDYLQDIRVAALVWGLATMGMLRSDYSNQEASKR